MQVWECEEHTYPHIAQHEVAGQTSGFAGLIVDGRGRGQGIHITHVSRTTHSTAGCQRAPNAHKRWRHIRCSYQVISPVTATATATSGDAECTEGMQQ